MQARRSSDYDIADEMDMQDIKEMTSILWKVMNQFDSTTYLGKHVITSCGARALVWASSQGIEHIAPEDRSEADSPSIIRNSNGAGDTLSAAIIAGIIKHKKLDSEFTHIYF